MGLNLQSRADKRLRDELLGDRDVSAVVATLERAQAQGSKGVRRHLLATSLRLSKAMAPDVFEMTAACQKALAIDAEIETYVYPSGDFNAAAVKPESGRLFIMLSSSLLETFKGDALKFVIGHELGHHLFQHHDIPLGQILGGETPPPKALALKLFAWSRHAEISADRAGAHCAQNPDAVADALFRLASGLRTDVVQINADAFASQLDAMTNEAQMLELVKKSRGEWFMTHPFTPLRLQALRLFFQSHHVLGDKGRDADALEAGTHALMALMEPSYLEDQSPEAEAMRRVLFAGAVRVAAADGKLGEKEIAAFNRFFGEGAFSENLDVDALVASLPDRIADAREIAEPKRMQLVRDLALIAKADGHINPKETEALYQLATELKVERVVVESILGGSLDLD